MVRGHDRERPSAHGEDVHGTLRRDKQPLRGVCDGDGDSTLVNGQGAHEAAVWDGPHRNALVWTEGDGRGLFSACIGRGGGRGAARRRRSGEEEAELRRQAEALKGAAVAAEDAQRRRARHPPPGAACAARAPARAATSAGGAAGGDDAGAAGREGAARPVQGPQDGRGVRRARGEREPVGGDVDRRDGVRVVPAEHDDLRLEHEHAADGAVGVSAREEPAAVGNRVAPRWPEPCVIVSARAGAQGGDRRRGRFKGEGAGGRRARLEREPLVQTEPAGGGDGEEAVLQGQHGDELEQVGSLGAAAPAAGQSAQGPCVWPHRIGPRKHLRLRAARLAAAAAGVGPGEELRRGLSEEENLRLDRLALWTRRGRVSGRVMGRVVDVPRAAAVRSEVEAGCWPAAGARRVPPRRISSAAAAQYVRQRRLWWLTVF
mmetsp:Transcript_17762/g.58397  ORF Transcript_17762/g.58397 Transcript_17762/m.58397 type:complete len:431 (-) Transcript_17762:73-1365(-)